MDQHAKAEEALGSNSSKLDQHSPPSSPPHHKSGHSVARRHHTSSHHQPHHRDKAHHHQSLSTGASHGTLVPQEEQSSQHPHGKHHSGGHHSDSRHHQVRHHGKPDSHHHRRHLTRGESSSHHSLEGSYHYGVPRGHGEHHHGSHHYHRDHHRHHGEHHSREHHQGSSQTFAPQKSHSLLGVSPHLGTKGSSQSMTTSHITFRSRISSKPNPQDTETWTEDEQYQKRKTRTQRTHKKHTGNTFQLLWEKINELIWGLRKMMCTLTQSLAFETFIFIVVCLNTVMLVAQTFTELEVRGEWYFMVLDYNFLSIYVVEALLKIIALSVEYFYDPWNNLDFFIMVMAVVDFVLIQINSLSYSFYSHSLFRILKVFKSMRALRAIRVLRRLSILTKLHEVTGTLSGSLPSITAILTLMFTCLFLFSVVLRALFRKSDPLRFQNIFTTLFTLFTMLTLDDWSLIYVDSRAQGAWYIIPILMIYIIIQYFIFLNLVIAVLVDNFQMALLRGLEKVKQEKAARVHEKLLEDSLTELSHAEPEAIMSEGTLKTQFIERKFGNMTEQQRELHFQFLQLVASVEQHQQKFRSQASVIDEIVDTAFEVGEEDFRK